MDVDLLLVPFDSGRRDSRMGAGPAALADGGPHAPALVDRLVRHGHRVRRATIEPPAGTWRAEIRTAYDLAAALAAEVRAARAAGRIPLVLSGNCGPAALGACAGLAAGVRVLWADAHGDFNTPETTVGGFLDGMALATLTGRCWTALAARVPGFAPVPEARVWLLGARDLDPAEAEALARSAVRRVPAAEVDAALGRRLAEEADADPTYLHLDLDVLDAGAGRANAYAAPGGVAPEALARFCRALRDLAPPAVVTLSAYDPAVDADGRVARAAGYVVDALFGGAGAPDA